MLTDRNRSNDTIINLSFDEATDSLRGAGLGTANVNSRHHSINTILNRVFDPATDTLNFSGGGGGGGATTAAGVSVADTAGNFSANPKNVETVLAELAQLTPGEKWTVVSASAALDPGNYLVDASGGALAFTLNFEAGGEYELFDFTNSATLNNITIGTGTDSFDTVSGLAQSGPYVIDIATDGVRIAAKTAANTYTVVKEAASAATANNRYFASNASINPATAEKPTLVEVQAAVTTATLTDVLVYYTGTDVSTDSETYIYLVDGAGVATLVKEPLVTVPKVIDTLTPTATNTIPDLSETPNGIVNFYISGVLDYANQLTASGTTVSVAPTISTVYGFDILSTDIVVAVFDQDEPEIRDTLTPTAVNTIPNLSQAPKGLVLFFIDGVQDYAGVISTAGATVSVSAGITAVYGFDIDATNTITALYY